jgi:hypothetical protein
MNKVLTLALVSALTLILSAGCSTKGKIMDAEASKEALYTNNHSYEKVANAIVKAGKTTNWKITKFKSNEVIAEKVGSGETISSSIKMFDGYLEFSNNSQTSDLRSAIKSELENLDKAHR